MTTDTRARRGLRFGSRTAALSAALLALTVGAPVAAQAELAHRLDVGEPVSGPPLVDDCSLCAPCSDLAGVVARSDTVDRNVARIRGPVRDTHLWSYADDGTLELRVNGVIQRHRPPPR